MQIHLNGKPYDSAQGMTVAQLLKNLGIEGNRVAVELNLNILPKDEYASCTLKESDQVEVVHFVGGGTSELGEKEKRRKG
ncbi:MAG: sulfur carrier protein ThiS [Candidatus Lindowbacteria bacterium]|nr:sulfur carrier protein ThiS [Candidatus Lindowbacteria bacterium]